MQVFILQTEYPFQKRKELTRSERLSKVVWTPTEFPMSMNTSIHITYMYLYIYICFGRQFSQVINTAIKPISDRGLSFHSMRTLCPFVYSVEPLTPKTKNRIISHIVAGPATSRPSFLRGDNSSVMADADCILHTQICLTLPTLTT